MANTTPTGTEADIRRRAIFNGGNKLIFGSDGQGGKTAFGLEDYRWTNNAITDVRKYSTIPYLFISEFQPDLLFNYGELVDAIGGKVVKKLTADNKAKKNKSADDAKTRGETPEDEEDDTDTGITGAVIGSAAKTALEKRIAQMKSDLQDWNNFSKSVIDTPTKFYKQILAGNVVATYKTPFIEDAGIYVDDHGWGGSSADDVLGKTIGGMITNTIPITIPGVPMWKADAEGSKAYSYKFHLINRDKDSVIKNTQFLRTFVGGAYWMQVDFFRKSPNLYHIWCPGQLRQYFCQMTFSVESKGRRRIPPTELVQKLFATAGTTSATGNQTNYADIFIPDYYEISVSFKSLIPNNYNMFLESIIASPSDLLNNNDTAQSGTINGALNLGGSALDTVTSLISID